MRTFATILGVALLIAAVSSIDAPAGDWNPNWTLRLSMAAVGVVLLALSLIRQKV